MSETRPGAAYAIGFRRDVTLFLSALVGFFVILILILIALIQVLVGQVERTTATYWVRTADAAARATGDMVATSPSARAAGLAALRASSGAVGIELRPASGAPIRVGTTDPDLAEPIVRQTTLGEATFYFDRTELDALRRRLLWLTAITFASVIGGTFLLLLYVRRIARPIERLLDEAAAVEERPHDVEETEYLVDAFRKTIATLKTQEAELKSLHEREKARADELEIVSGTLTRSLTSGFLALGPDGGLVEINDAGRQILGLGEVRLGARPHEALGAGGFATTLETACARREALTRVEIPAETPAGTRVVGLSTAPLTADDGRFLGLLALFTDLSPVRDLETRLRETRALADLGELAAGIAHEFRNSLSAIGGYLKLATREPLPPDAAARLRAAEEESALLGDAVSALLGFASPMQLNAAEVDLRHVLETTAARLRQQGDRVEIRLDCDAATVAGDAALLSRAFENVIRNGVEAVERSATDGSVAVACSAHEGHTEVIVDDEGAGVDPEQIPSLFLPFRSGRPGGFGLGLALAKKIVVLHGGSITMEPRDGGGTRVRIELPTAT
ncbi:MAG: sensor histidine kinase [Thermoanaerobaculia bacterium]